MIRITRRRVARLTAGVLLLATGVYLARVASILTAIVLAELERRETYAQ